MLRNKNSLMKLSLTNNNFRMSLLIKTGAKCPKIKVPTLPHPCGRWLVCLNKLMNRSLSLSCSIKLLNALLTSLSYAPVFALNTTRPSPRCPVTRLVWPFNPPLTTHCLLPPMVLKLLCLALGMLSPQAQWAPVPLGTLRIQQPSTPILAYTPASPHTLVH